MTDDQAAPLPDDAVEAGAEAIYPPTRYGRDEQHCRVTAMKVLAAAAPALRALGAAAERERIRQLAIERDARYMPDADGPDPAWWRPSEPFADLLAGDTE